MGTHNDAKLFLRNLVHQRVLFFLIIFFIIVIISHRDVKGQLRLLRVGRASLPKLQYGRQRQEKAFQVSRCLDILKGGEIRRSEMKSMEMRLMIMKRKAID